MADSLFSFFVEYSVSKRKVGHLLAQGRGRNFQIMNIWILKYMEDKKVEETYNEVQILNLQHYKK